MVQRVQGDQSSWKKHTPTLPGSGDIRTARIIVGNGPAGDTADDCDFLDIGNGAGVAAALAAATALATPVDIFVKSGHYDLTAAGAPALPLSVPRGILFRGAGHDVLSTLRGTLFILGGTNRALFVGAGSYTEMRDFGVRLPAADPGAVGDAIIDLDAGSSNVLTDITINFPGASGDSADESLIAAVRLDGSSMATRVGVWAQGYGTVARTLACFTGGFFYTACTAVGLDIGYQRDGARSIFTGCRAFSQTDTGFHLSNVNHRVVGCWIRNAGVRGVLLANGAGSSVVGTGIKGESSATGIEVADDHNDACIVGNVLENLSVGVDVGENDGTLIGVNKYRTVINEMVIAAGATDVGREVPTVLSDTIFTANHTAEVGEILRYDASGGTFTLQAPSSPARGDEFGIKEMVNNAALITVSGNGQNIQNPVTGLYTGVTTTVAVANIGARWIFDGTQWFTP